MIKNIIFDSGGVILKHKSTIMEEMVSQIFSIPLKQADAIWKKEKPLIMSGKTSSYQFLNRLKTELHSDKSINDILSQWKTSYINHAKDVDWDLLTFIDRLTRNYKVYLFTDTIDSNDEYNTKRGIYDKFIKVFKSNEEGFTKHDGNDAFLNVLNKIHAKSEECVFIDDLVVNIDKANELGIKGILYANQENLMQELSKQGISIV